MGSDFPVPRDKLPRIDVSPHEREARRAQMGRILQTMLDDYEHFRDVDQGRVNPKLWKLAATREALQLFRERRAGSTVKGGSLSGGSETRTPSFSVSSDEERGSMDSIFDGGSSASGLSQSKRKNMLLVGEFTGRVESAIFAAMTKSYEEFALAGVFLNDTAADCLVKMIDGPTAEKPLHFLGYKWFVNKSPGGGRLVKHRDSLYVEACGMTKTRKGEDIGYLLMESVDLPGFPPMPERNCIRAMFSVQFLMRQRTDTTVEVFVKGLVDPGGHMGRLGTLLTYENTFMVACFMDLAEAKRLTKMLMTYQQARDEAMYNRRFKPTACTLCHQQRKFYNGVSLVDCGICGQVVCTRCRVSKRVFISDEHLGRFHRVGCCKTCVLAANQSRPNAAHTQLKVSISSQLQRQNSSRDFTNTFDSFHSSRPRSSSESSIATNELFDLSHPDVPRSTRAAQAIASARKGSVELTSAPGNVRRYGGGMTLLSPRSTPRQQRREPQTFDSGSSFALVTMPDTRRRGDSTSSIDSSSGRIKSSAIVRSSPIEVLPSARAREVVTPDFVSSAPGGAYDLRRNITAPPAGAQPAKPIDLFAQMMELRRLAESTYQTTQQNQAFMEHHQTTHQANDRAPFF